MLDHCSSVSLMCQDDREGLRTIDDDNFIDDSGVDPADRYRSDNEPHSPGSAPQVSTPCPRPPPLPSILFDAFAGLSYCSSLLGEI